MANCQFWGEFAASVQCGLASEGQQRYTKYTKPLKTYGEYIYMYIYIYTVGARWVNPYKNLNNFLHIRGKDLFYCLWCMSLCWLCRNFTVLGWNCFVWQTFFEKKKIDAVIDDWRFLREQIWKLYYCCPLELQQPVFFLNVYLYVAQVLTKFHCPKLKTFFLTEFLWNL